MVKQPGFGKDYQAAVNSLNKKLDDDAAVKQAARGTNHRTIKMITTEQADKMIVKGEFVLVRARDGEFYFLATSRDRRCIMGTIKGEEDHVARFDRSDLTLV